jgi:hypothetical protein
MMPRLEAERSLAHITDTAAAFGSMKEEDSGRYMQQLKRAAGGGVVSRQEKAAGAAAMLASLGVPVETIEPEGGEK